MQHTLDRRRTLLWFLAGCAALAFFRNVLAALAVQLLAAWLLMAPALPFCRLLERRIAPGPAAALSLLALAALILGVLLGLIPPILRQFRQLTGDLPLVLNRGQTLLTKAQSFLQTRGIDLAPLREELFNQLSRWAATLVSGAAQTVRQAAQTMGKLFLAPLISFYLLRDRRRIVSWLELLIPVRYRARSVRAGREMRRETVNFLRGQLMLSLTVGALTALGLLLAGTPGWLVLGLFMGVMELIPYAGPLIAGVPAVLLSLQSGWPPALWTLGVLVLVQQIESSLLSPRFLSGATRLHPLTVLLTISAGGMLAGAWGMVVALPAAVCLRGALRGWRT